MAKLTYSQRETVRLLNLTNGRALDSLIESGTLRVAAINREGRRLFFAEDVSRAAAELALPSRKKARS